MIVDCFPFFNELDILELRLNILSNYVDKFVLIEANKTQSFLDKPYYFDINKERFSKFLDKIVHIKMDENINKSEWGLENFQRNYIIKGLSEIQITNKDIVAISDVDEIWDPFCLEDIQKNLKTKNFVSISMDYLVFYLNLQTENKGWIGSVFTSAKSFLQATPQGVRNIKDRVSTIPNAGWHFGYQGGKEMVYEKYFSCVEPISKNLIPSKEEFDKIFNERARDGGSFIFSDNIADETVKLKKYPMDKLPYYLNLNLDKYSHMLIK